MLKYYVSYITNTGFITKKGAMSIDDPIEIQNTETETAMEVSAAKYDQIDSSKEYIMNNQFLFRQESPITRTGPLSFSNIPYQVPAKAFVTIEGTKYEITEDHLDLEITFPGTYTILFESFPYKEKQFVVEVT